MLRVSFMHMFNRGRLGQLVSLLSGRDFETRTYTEEIEAASFSKLSAGVINFMIEYNFKNFVLAIRSAGFISPKLLRSKMTLIILKTMTCTGMPMQDSFCIFKAKAMAVYRN